MNDYWPPQELREQASNRRGRLKADTTRLPSQAPLA